jgi:hypothetical protein
MPTLNWIGKEAVVNHHQQVPFRLLKDVPDLAKAYGVTTKVLNQAVKRNRERRVKYRTPPMFAQRYGRATSLDQFCTSPISVNGQTPFAGEGHAFRSHVHQ